MSELPPLSAAPPRPTRIEVKKTSRSVRVSFANGEAFEISAKRLRAASPAADGAPKSPLPDDLTVTAMDAVGNYAVRPHFSDGHQTGIYDFNLLYQIAKTQP